MLVDLAYTEVTRTTSLVLEKNMIANDGAGTLVSSLGPMLVLG
jgi:hypothetical protein